MISATNSDVHYFIDNLSDIILNRVTEINFTQEGIVFVLNKLNSSESAWTIQLKAYGCMISIFEKTKNDELICSILNKMMDIFSFNLANF